jgi:hypothetical protein
MDYAVLIARMNVTQFRQFKKAFNVLLRAGVAPSDGITILIEKYSRHVERDMRAVR